MSGPWIHVTRFAALLIYAGIVWLVYIEGQDAGTPAAVWVLFASTCASIELASSVVLLMMLNRCFADALAGKTSMESIIRNAAKRDEEMARTRGYLLGALWGMRACAWAALAHSGYLGVAVTAVVIYGLATIMHTMRVGSYAEAVQMLDEVAAVKRSAASLKEAMHSEYDAWLASRTRGTK